MILPRCRIKKILLSCVAMSLVGGVPGIANAASFYLQEQSASALSTAFAGVAADARDASIIFYNTAGMTELEGPEIYFNNQVLVTRMDMSDNGSTLFGGPSGGVDSDDPVPTVYMPALYAAMPVYEDSLWLGLGVTIPFGLSTQYDSDWHGRYDSIKSMLMTYDIQPSVAYEVNNWLSLGGGVSFQYAEAKLSNAVHNGVTEGTAVLEGDDWSTGFNVGAIVKPTPATKVGLSYRQGMTQELEGNVTVTGVAGLNESSNASADIDLPDVIELGVAHELNDRWTLFGQANYVDWDVLEEIVAVRDDGSVITTIEHDYDSTLVLSVGAEFKATDRLTVRAGYQRNPTPTKDETRNTTVPDGDRNMFAAGATYKFTDALSVDFAANYTLLSDEDIDVSRNGGTANVRIGRDDTSYNLVAIGFKYKFPAASRAK